MFLISCHSTFDKTLPPTNFAFAGVTSVTMRPVTLILLNFFLTGATITKCLTSWVAAPMVHSRSDTDRPLRDSNLKSCEDEPVALQLISSTPHQQSWILFLS